MAVSDSTFDTMFRQNLAILGDDASFVPRDGQTVTGIQVWPDREMILQSEGYEGQVYAQVDTIEAILADLGKEPDEGDVFVVGAYRYTVTAPMENDGATVKVAVRKQRIA